MSHKFLAFYLPQYYPIPENDKWWGKGFTEWTNSVKTKPKFKDHYQPHLPSDLGFYDLRVEETRIAQAELAKKYGIDGFVYYHYWFSGKRLLNLPLDKMLSTKKPDFPFCLCWANENWSKKSGPTYNTGINSKKILLKQNYSDKDDFAHIKWLATVFSDKRYIRIENKPLFIVFRPSLLPNPILTAKIWRQQARRMGIGEIYLCHVQAFPEDRINPSSMGFDAAIDFQPNDSLRKSTNDKYPGVTSEYLFSYEDTVRLSLSQPNARYLRFPCIMPSWDNSPRRIKGATIYLGSNPKLYEKWVGGMMKKIEHFSDEKKIIFINAWNEWAEGCYLEPDTKWGREYLNAHKKAIDSHKPQTGLKRHKRIH